MHAEPLGELALGQPERDPKVDERAADPMQVHERAQLSSSCLLIVFDLLLEPEMKRPERLHGTLNLLSAEAYAPQPRLVLDQALPLLAEPASRLLVLRCPSDHADHYAKLDIFVNLEL